QSDAGRFGSVVSLPPLETSPEEVRQSVSNAITVANAELDKIGALDPQSVTLSNTLVALDHLGYVAGLTANRVGLLKETSTNAAIRDTGTEMTKVFSDWAVGLDYREDVYKSVKAFSD